MLSKIDRLVLSILFIGLFIGLFYFFLNRNTFSIDEDYYNAVPLDNKNQIIISKKIPNYYDTVLRVCLDQVQIENTIIVIDKLSQTAKADYSSIGSLKAHLRYENGIFYLFIDSELSRQEVIEILAHETVHFQQYYTSKLVFDDASKTIYWNNRSYYYDELEYTDRPWELEAFSKQRHISNITTKILF